MTEQVINVAINKELWKEVGVKAILEDVDKKEIVDKALKEYLRGKENENKEV